MSEQEITFLEQLQGKFDKAIEDIERRHTRTVTTISVLSGAVMVIVGIVLAFTLQSFGTVGKRLSDTEAASLRNEKDITYILQNTPSKKSFNMILESINQQSKIEEAFFPNNIKEGIKEMRKFNEEQRAEIMKYVSDINNRGEKLPTK
jgi:biopolymer transport protein ExbB/TolQ